METEESLRLVWVFFEILLISIIFEEKDFSKYFIHYNEERKSLHYSEEFNEDRTM